MFSFKKTILYLLLLTGICIFCFKCAGKSSGSSKKSGIDSVRYSRVLAVFKSAITGQPDMGVIKKVFVPDTLSWKDIGRSEMKLMRGPDSFYAITYNLFMLDSAGNQMRDSAGKLRFRTQEIETDKKWVRSGWENLDSAIKELNELK